MSKFGIKSVSYIPLCSTEEIKLEIKKPTGNEIVKKMWDKLDDEEQGFINVMIDRDNKQNEEIERLNNAIDRAIAFIEQNLLPSHNIKNTDWEFEEVIYSDLPVGVIKPLIDILKEVNK